VVNYLITFSGPVSSLTQRTGQMTQAPVQINGKIMCNHYLDKKKNTAVKEYFGCLDYFFFLYEIEKSFSINIF